MWHQWLSRIWRRLPKRVRRWGILLSQPRFTVTAGAVVVDDQQRVLLLHHRFRGGSGWGIPGGFLNPRESPEEALRRELREEINLELDNVEIAFTHRLQAYQQIEIVFRATPRNAVQICSAEISRAEWFALYRRCARSRRRAADDCRFRIALGQCRSACAGAQRRQGSGRQRHTTFWLYV